MALLLLLPLPTPIGLPAAVALQSHHDHRRQQQMIIRTPQQLSACCVVPGGGGPRGRMVAVLVVPRQRWMWWLSRATREQPLQEEMPTAMMHRRPRQLKRHAISSRSSSSSDRHRLGERSIACQCRQLLLRHLASHCAEINPGLCVPCLYV
jgi:hypothetical protein